MKATLNTLWLFSVIIVLAACKNQAEPEVKTVETETSQKILNPDAEYITASFEIEGMSCPMGCAKPIEKNLAMLNGVKEAKVDFDTKTATVVYDESLASKSTFIESVQKTGEAYSVISWNGEYFSDK